MQRRGSGGSEAAWQRGGGPRLAPSPSALTTPPLGRPLPWASSSLTPLPLAAPSPRSVMAGVLTGLYVQLEELGGPSFEAFKAYGRKAVLAALQVRPYLGPV